MSTKRPSVSTLSDLIQKYVGSDYDNISELGEQLEAILALSGLTATVDYTTEGFPQDTLEDLLREFAITIRQNQVVADSVPEISNSVALNNLSIISILETGIFKGTIDVNSLENDWVLNEADMVSNSDSKVSTQRAIRQFVEDSIANSTGFQGEYDANDNVPQLDDRDAPGNPIIPGIKRADSWTVTETGTFFTLPIAIGDTLQAVIDDPLTVGDWVVINNTLSGASIAALYEAYADVNRFDDNNLLKLSGIEPGATGDQIASEVPYDFPVDGGALTVSVNTGGQDYTVGLILSATSGTGAGLEIRVDEIDNGALGGIGAISGFTIIAAGQDYLDTDTGITFTSLLGTLATFNIDTVEVAEPDFTPTNVRQAIQDLFALAKRTVVDPTDGTLYLTDVSRGNKQLSSSEATYTFSKDGLADAVYLKPGTINSTTTSYRLPRNATLVGVQAEGTQEVEGVGDGNVKTFEIRKNGNEDSFFELDAGIFTAPTYNRDFDAGDVVQLYARGTGDPVNNAIVTLYFKWRKV